MREWIRWYVDSIHDDRLRLLAFEDRYHFVAICCLEATGLLTGPASEIRTRRIAINLELSLTAADEVRRRLLEVELIDEDWHPLAWDRLQYASDAADPTAAQRMRRYRERKRNKRNDTVTLRRQISETDSDTEKRGSAGRAVTRPRDEMAEELAGACGLDLGKLTKSERGAFNRALKEIRDAGAAPGEIRARAAAYRKRWPNVELTVTALARHWNECIARPATAETPRESPEERELRLAQAHWRRLVAGGMKLPPRGEREPAADFIDRIEHALTAEVVGRAEAMRRERQT